MKTYHFLGKKMKEMLLSLLLLALTDQGTVQANDRA